MRAFPPSLLLAFALAAPARAAVSVVTTTEDLAAIVREVAGSRIKVKALLAGDKDPIAPKRLTPDMPVTLSSAELLVVVGSGLEDRWLPRLIGASRNAVVQPGQRGHLDLSPGVDLLEVPKDAKPRPGKPDDRPDGNPHYWLDPANGHRLAKALAKRLTLLDAAGAAEFARRSEDFDRRLSEGEARWGEALAPFKGRKLAVYDNTWSYLAERYGLELVPAEGMADAEPKLLLVEPFVDMKAAGAVAAKAGGRVLVLPSSVGGVKAATGYIALFDEIVARLVPALR